MSRERRRNLLAGFALTVLAAFPLLWRLEVPLLWQDEAETANLAMNLLERGYPTPWDGSHLVTQQAGRDSVRLGEHLLWAWHPWPQHYLAAAGLGFLGRGTAQARLPFALVALASVPLFFAWRVGRSRFSTAVVATAIYSLAPVFFLFSRQSRYYVLLILGGVWALHAYQAQSAATVGGPAAGPSARPRSLSLGTALALVFYANPLSGIAFATGLGIHAWLSAHPLRPLARSFALFLLLAFPWLALVALSEVRTPDLGLAARSGLYASQLWRLQYGLLPLALWPALGWLWWRCRCRGQQDEQRSGGRAAEPTTGGPFATAWELGLLATLVAVMWLVVVPLAPVGSVRYALPIWPLAAAALAALWQALSRRSAAIAGLFLALLLLTDLFPSLPALPLALARPEARYYDREARALDKLAFNGRVTAPLPRHLAQLARRECGPVAAIVALGRALERPPGLAVAAYGWESLRFYLGGPAVDPSGQRAARNRLGLPPAADGQNLGDSTPATKAAQLGVADLLTPRRGWPPLPFDPSGRPGLVAIDLGVPDDAYENLPDPDAHRYSPTPVGALPSLVVWVGRDLLPDGGLGPLQAPGCAPLTGARVGTADLGE